MKPDGLAASLFLVGHCSCIVYACLFRNEAAACRELQLEWLLTASHFESSMRKTFAIHYIPYYRKVRGGSRHGSDLAL